MRRFILYFLTVVLVGELVYLGFVLKAKNQKKVLAEEIAATQTPSQTPSASASPTPILSPSPSPSPKPSPSPTISPSPIPNPTQTPVPQPQFTSEQINGFIERFAAQYQVSADILRHIALCESGFNPLAFNSGYGGLYQFAFITWQNLRTEMGEDPEEVLRFNAEEAVQTAAYVLHKGSDGIWPNCVP